MSKNNQVKKAKVVKQKKSIPFGKIFYYIKGSFKNDLSIEIGSKTKWYWLVIIFFVSIFLSMTPLTVHLSQKNGQDYINGVQGDAFEFGLNDFINNSESTGDIVFDKETPVNGVTKYNVASLKGEMQNAPAHLLYAYKRNYDNGTSVNKKIDLEIYYVDVFGGEDFNTIYQDISKKDSEGNDRTSSFILFGKEGFSSWAYAIGATSSQYGIGGNFINFNDIYGTVGTTTQFSFKEYLKKDGVKVSEIKKSYGELVNIMYEQNKKTGMLVQSGIILGVDAGLILLIGLIFFLLTRSKMSPFKPKKWYTFFGIAIWIAMIPALLALIGGFLLPGYEIMIFVVTYGMRAMWMSMRQLRPMQ